MDEVGVSASARRLNGKAVASFVLGLIGLTGILFVAAIVAIALGQRSRREIDESGEKGAALATTGIVLGWIGLAEVVLFIIYFALGMTEVL